MNLDGIEPRRTLWAPGEVWWEDATGNSCRAPATIEDTSPSGACLRVKAAIEVGSNLTVKWHREQFSGVARNRRRDGSEFLVGIQRRKGDPDHATGPSPTGNASPAAEAASAHAPAAANVPLDATEPPHALVPTHTNDTTTSLYTSAAKVGAPSLRPDSDQPPANNAASECAPPGNPSAPPEKPPLPSPRSSGPVEGNPLPVTPVLRPESQAEGSAVRHERRVMQSTPLFRKLWRHQPDPTGGPDHATPTEVPVSKSDVNPAESISGTMSVLLPCDDIYRASGILGVGSKYDIAKIVEMLSSKHIRELPKEVRRASVLMALDAAGTTVDEVLNDAARRLHALNSYESAQQKQFEQFEADKTRENAQINVEIERVTARYAERIKQNLDQVAREKEALLNWQLLKEEESQRIADAVALCGKQPAAEPPAEPASVLAKGAAASQTGASTEVSMKPPAVPIR